MRRHDGFDIANDISPRLAIATLICERTASCATVPAIKGDHCIKFWIGRKTAALG
jgi:hypothetical protein